MARSNRDDYDEAVVIDAYRSKLENLYNPTGNIYAHDAFDFLKDRADEMASETFDAFDWDIQCEIPADWKTNTGVEIDVMDFLGIQRVEPLIKPSK